jgi:hypothetical protein
MSDLDPVSEARANLLADIRHKVAVAVAELDRGEGVDLDVVVEQLRQKFQFAKKGV